MQVENSIEDVVREMLIVDEIAESHKTRRDRFARFIEGSIDSFLKRIYSYHLKNKLDNIVCNINNKVTFHLLPKTREIDDFQTWV